MSLMGNVIETVRSTGSDYWAAYVSGEKIKTGWPLSEPQFHPQQIGNYMMIDVGFHPPKNWEVLMKIEGIQVLFVPELTSC